MCKSISFWLLLFQLFLFLLYILKVQAFSVHITLGTVHDLYYFHYVFLSFGNLQLLDRRHNLHFYWLKLKNSLEKWKIFFPPIVKESNSVVFLCVKSECHSVASDSLGPHGLYSPWNSPGQNTGVGSLSLLQGNFPTHALNPGLLNCRQILSQLSHKGSPRILEWVAYTTHII